MSPALGSMPPVTLDDLEREGLARAEDDRVAFKVMQDWAAPGEQRIGYAGILRLVECVREFHWARDVLPAAGRRQIDSVARSLTADFLTPVAVGDHLVGRYRITWCRRRSYGLEVLLATTDGVDLVLVSLASVFYDPVGRSSVTPPAPVLAALRSLSRSEPPAGFPTPRA
jgi:acyl-CoA thioesterase FadM